MFLLKWDEPFGLVAAEAQAAGTAILAFPRGSMPEIVQNGRTGFLVEDMDQACQAVEKLDCIDPVACRKNAEERFSAAVMTDEYEAVYYNLTGRERSSCLQQRCGGSPDGLCRIRARTHQQGG